MQQEAEGRVGFSAASASQRHIVLCAARDHTSAVCLSSSKRDLKTIKPDKAYH